jgi:hypothetical protein
MNKHFTYIGNSPWTNSSKSMARHIALENGAPLCGKTYKNGATDRYPLSLKDITCKKCLKLFLGTINPYSLYLDDERDPKTNRDWIIVRSYDEFVNTIQELGIPAYISFDHDLSEEKTGMNCAKWLVDNNIVLEDFNVHSANPVGGGNIKRLLENWKKFNLEK